MIEGKTKEVLWVMGGNLNIFTDVTEGNTTARFAFQHDARVSGKNRFTLFDNHSAAHNGFCEDHGGPCSRGLEVEYDPVKKVVWVLNEWWHPQSLISASRGSTQRTPNGNVIVAWGQNPMYTEYAPDGELVMDVQRGRVRDIKHGIVGVNSYRIWKGDWEGDPPWGPNVACDPDDTGRSVYVSWNGATKVDKWVMVGDLRIVDFSLVVVNYIIAYVRQYDRPQWCRKGCRPISSEWLRDPIQAGPLPRLRTHRCPRLPRQDYWCNSSR